MPVPDMQPRFRDFEYCEFCNRCFQDDYFVTVLFDNEKLGKDNEKRIFRMCKDCREKCRIDRAFEKYATKKTFRMKLGIRVNKK